MSTVDAAPAADVRQLHQRGLAQVGATRREHLGVVRRRDFERFAVAAGDANPVYHDDEAARAAGHPGVIAHPVFLSAVMGWRAGPDEADLRADGSWEDGLVGSILGGLRLMGGGQDIEVRRPLADGDDVTVETEVAALDLKTTERGDLLVLTLRRRYLDAGGAEISVCTERFIGR